MICARAGRNPDHFGGIDRVLHQDIAAVAIDMCVGVVEAHQLNNLRQPLQDLAGIVVRTARACGPRGPAMRTAIAAWLGSTAAARQRSLDENIDFSRIFYLLHRVLRGLETSGVQPSRRIRNGQGAARRDFPSPSQSFGW
jgi:hypothetical protein